MTKKVLVISVLTAAMMTDARGLEAFGDEHIFDNDNHSSCTRYELTAAIGVWF